jgi:hypothetical protein
MIDSTKVCGLAVQVVSGKIKAGSWKLQTNDRKSNFGCTGLSIAWAENNSQE